MTHDFQRHKSILLQILKDIYSDTSISPYLGFKGGTAAYLFYDLKRNSVDLDFDLLEDTKETQVFETIQKIISTYGTITESRIKRFNLFNVVSYEHGKPQIKIEVSSRHFESSYEVKTVLGIAMLVMVKEDMFAHKLMALYERIGKTSRDLFDVYTFFKNGWTINRTIVESRSGMPFKGLLEQCIQILEKMDNKHTLDGLGELLSEPQKDWARTKLKADTLFLLKLAIDAEK